MSEPEPHVLTSDVRHEVLEALKHVSVPLLAERAGTSERTVYRVRDNEYDVLMDLGLADGLLVASGAELSHCTIIWPDGTVEWGY